MGIVSLINCFEEISTPNQENQDLNRTTELIGNNGAVLMTLYKVNNRDYKVCIQGYCEGKILPIVTSKPLRTYNSALTFSYKALLYYESIIN